ncbi:hypothetical protein CL617_00725 [archaeon]|nr:hypothetical protein [archaeon]|tara:strand:+ start:3523 stop:4389 length:867 start_codon:yes stop_codon:yes gene_type:complete
MNLDIILIIITLIALIIASITDFKKREIPDFLSYSLLSTVIFIKILQAIIERSFTPIIYGLIGFTVFFAIALFMYYTKQWGGGDSKVLMSLGIVFSEYPKTLLNYFTPNLNIPILASLFINILLLGSFYGIFYSMFLAIKNRKTFIEELKKVKSKNTRHYLISALIILALSFLIKEPKQRLLILFLAFILLISPYLITYIKIIEKSCMIKKIKTNKLTEGDWINQDIKSKDKTIYSKKSLGVTIEQIQKIKKLNLKYVIVKEGIPFIPSFLLAFIVTLIYGNILLFFL